VKAAEYNSAVPETLQDHLRRSTRNFTARLPEDQVLALGLDLLRELERAHGETPQRHPSLDPASIAMTDGKPRLDSGSDEGDAARDLFSVGALLNSLATGTPAEVAWRLDGPPAAEASTLLRRDVLATLASPRPETRFATARAASEAFARAAATDPDAAAPWPMFRGDAQRTGSRPAAAAAGFKTQWEALAGAVVASPALTDRFALVPTADGRLLFVDQPSGRVVHQLAVASAIESSPAIDGGRAYLGTDDGELVAVDVALGKEAFRVKLGQLVRSAPLVASGKVIVGVVEGKSAGSLVALDAAKGKVLWKCRLAAVFSSPTLAGTRVLVGSDDGSVHAVDLEKGSLAWSRPMGAKVRATPSVAGERAIVADFGGRVAALGVADGAPTWTAELGHPVYSSPALGSGLAVLGCNEGHVHAIDAATGVVRFEVATRGPVVASAVALGERFLAASTDGEVYLLGATGEVLQHELISRAGLQSSPALAADLLLLGSGAGVHALRLTP
jgi:outer membrane protein assembly factor BamB